MSLENVYILFTMSTITGSQQHKSTGSTEKYISAQSFSNVSYGSDSLHKMDIYLPAGRNPDSAKSIILIHGGGWNGGCKSEFTVYIDSFKKRMPDYAIFNLNYRLANGGHLFPTQELDVKAAIDFITAQADEYGINKNNLVLLGVSAGGHLALLQAYKYSDPKIRAVIDFFGPTDLLTMYQQPWHPLVPYALQMITGTTPATDAELYKQSSPITYVNNQSTPTLILHGGNDSIVDISQSKALKHKLEKEGVVHHLVIYPKERHGWQGTTLSNSFYHIESFLKSNVP